MISSTGKGIRKDPAGDGRFRAKRGNRLHKGVDDLCTPGQWVVSPITGRVTREARPYAKSDLSGLEIMNADMTVLLFYLEPLPGIIGSIVNEGDHIGQAQDVSQYYKNPKMLPHIHREIREINPKFLERQYETIRRLNTRREKRNL